ncbi:MAG: hypothetical protein AUH72_05275 [Acidobacteria bacterium 13_1_40CM_4_65_8]|nr:MAG: hypothetical protein AUH72_05275 [Acidobacteria bacterium 13_1_40CM_4_65_8]
MKLFIVAIDEPIYLNRYVRRLIERFDGEVVGVAKLTARRRRRTLPATAALALLALVVFSPRDLMRLIGLKLRELAAGVLPVPTRHTLADICRELRIPFTTIATANAPEFVATIERQGVDVVLNQTPEILRSDILRAPRRCVINRHMAWLPSYRGAWPVFWQFVNGEQRLGLTIHKVDERIDTGPIILREAIARLPDDTVAAAYRRLFERSVELTCDALRRVELDMPTIPNEGPDVSCYATPHAGDVARFMLGRRGSPLRRIA